ncbi:SusC/RagA family TonB-linked outer membrane protein [Pedobacter sp. PAMC26386]|nr:SusC/RagA family TonB-linked outer membrane protein [Pedobacter sp. PAMC26386]
MRKGYLRGVSLVLAMLLCSFSLWAQQKISGTVMASDDKLPVIGASIRVKGKPLTAMTDSKGAFLLPAKTGDVLEISFIGYLKQEVELSAMTPLSIILVADKRQLSEVVVTAFGVKKESKKIGYALQEIKGEELVKARDPNPIAGLTGKIAGLSVGPSAEMLRKPTVLLRGNEISLYVVDGVPISSDTWNISPDDIETYTVLKGPSAAALYGSRAQNGAILITTKKGNHLGKRFTVEFNSSTAIDKGFLTFPRLQKLYGAGDGETYAFKDGKGNGTNDSDYDVLGPYFNGQPIPQYDSPIDPVTGNRIPTPWLARGKNNLKNFLQTGFQTTNNLALSAEGDDYNLRFSLSNAYQSSIYPNTSLNNTNFNVYGSYNPTKNLKIEGNINYSRQYSPNVPEANYGPNSVLYSLLWTGADWDINDMKDYWQPGKEGVQSKFAEYQRYHNPYFMTNEWLHGFSKNDVYGYLSANYKIDDHLSTTLRSQITTYDLLRTEKVPFSAHPYGRNEALGDYREDRRSLFENNTDLLLNYNYTVGNFVNLSGLIGGSMRNLSYNSNYTSTDYLNVPGVYAFSNTRNPLLASSFNSDMRVLSAYYSLDASFGKYLTISTTGRVDKSSALAPGNNSYFYPSVSASTVLTDYLKLPDFISYLKVRGSFAAVRGGGTSSTIGQNLIFYRDIGGDKVVDPYNISTTVTRNGAYNYQSPYGGPDYSLIPTYNTGKVYGNQVGTTYTDNLYNANIKSYNRIAYEQGIDIKFLHNRLGISATAFQYIDGPQILSNEVSSATGFNRYVLNALKTKNTGYEISVSGTPVKNEQGFSWDVLANFSTYKMVYKELPEGQDTYNRFYHVGDRVDKYYSTGFVKDNSGNVIYNGGLPLTNPQPQFLGNFNPDFGWSLYNKFNYKNLSLSFQFDGSVGGVITDYFHQKSMQAGNNIETVEGAIGDARYKDWQNTVTSDPNYKGSFVGQGVTITNKVAPVYDSRTGAILNYDQLQFGPNTTPTMIDGYLSKYYGTAEANLMSKTYAKLREVTFTYNLPKAWLAKTLISKASISLYARNVLYFYKDKRFKDVDLDQYNSTPTLAQVGNPIYGSTDLQSPTTRRFGLNLNIVF